MFFRQCFSRKIYIFLALCTGLNAASNICRGMFNMLFATKELGLSFALVGKIAAIGSLISAMLVFCFGKLMDKTHPMLIYFVGGILIMLVNVFGYFFVYAKPVTYEGSIAIFGMSHTFHYSWTYAQLSYGVIAVVTALMYAFQNLANTPLQVSIFPMEKFGQYASSNSMVINVTLIIASAIGGVVTQHLGYRVMFVWDFIVTGMATLALLVVYHEWKRYGGKNYQAPVVK
jgi:maltose/moltooligosaccharide transporter